MRHCGCVKGWDVSFYIFSLILLLFIEGPTSDFPEHDTTSTKEISACFFFTYTPVMQTPPPLDSRACAAPQPLSWNLHGLMCSLDEYGYRFILNSYKKEKGCLLSPQTWRHIGFINVTGRENPLKGRTRTVIQRTWLLFWSPFPWPLHS